MTAKRLLSPEEAKEKLERDFIRLPDGSFFKWIEKDWWSRFLPFMARKNGAFIPRLDMLQEISIVLNQYRDYEFRKFGAEKFREEELNSLVSSS